MRNSRFLERKFDSHIALYCASSACCLLHVRAYVCINYGIIDFCLALGISIYIDSRRNSVNGASFFFLFVRRSWFILFSSGVACITFRIRLRPL